MFKYIQWDSLDPSKRYSVVDTMALVDLQRGALDSGIGMAEAVGGDTILVVPGVVKEVAIKCMELGGCRWSTLEEFEESLVSCLDWFGAPYLMARPSDDIMLDAAVQCEKGDYVNKKGNPLSPVDCTLLCAAVRTKNVDVVTADGKLAEAVSTLCGKNRVYSSRVNYYRRRRSTAWFVKAVAGIDVEWTESGTVLEYAARDGPVIILDMSRAEPAISAHSMISKPYAAEAVRTYFMVAIQYMRCPCGSGDGGPFRCGCPEFPYVNDGGLDRERMLEYMESLPFRERSELYLLARMFG